VATFTTAQVTTNDIVKAMVGRDLPARATHSSPSGRAEARRAKADALATKRLTLTTEVSRYRIECRLRRNRRHLRTGRLRPLRTARNDLRSASSNRREICVDGAPVTFRSPRDAARAGIVLVPEERHRQGLWFNFDLRNNLSIPRATLNDDVMVKADGGTPRCGRHDR
jgi:inositol transport system ATP-binding protein